MVTSNLPFGRWACRCVSSSTVAPGALRLERLGRRRCDGTARPLPGRDRATTGHTIPGPGRPSSTSTTPAQHRPRPMSSATPVGHPSDHHEPRHRAQHAAVPGGVVDPRASDPSSKRPAPSTSRRTWRPDAPRRRGRSRRPRRASRRPFRVTFGASRPRLPGTAPVRSRPGPRRETATASARQPTSGIARPASWRWTS